MKTFLALLIAYTAYHIAYDRAYQREAVQARSPEIKQCQFQPLLTYGMNIKIRGYFEKGSCF